MQIHTRRFVFCFFFLFLLFTLVPTTRHTILVSVSDIFMLSSIWAAFLVWRKKRVNEWVCTVLAWDVSCEGIANVNRSKKSWSAICSNFDKHDLGSPPSKFDKLSRRLNILGRAPCTVSQSAEWVPYTENLFSLWDPSLSYSRIYRVPTNWLIYRAESLRFNKLFAFFF